MGEGGNASANEIADAAVVEDDPEDNATETLEIPHASNATTVATSDTYSAEEEANF